MVTRGERGNRAEGRAEGDGTEGAPQRGGEGAPPMRDGYTGARVPGEQGEGDAQ